MLEKATKYLQKVLRRKNFINEGLTYGEVLKTEITLLRFLLLCDRCDLIMPGESEKGGVFNFRSNKFEQYDFRSNDIVNPEYYILIKKI